MIARPYFTAARRQASSSRAIGRAGRQRDRLPPIFVEPLDLVGHAGELIAEGGLVVVVGVGVDVVRGVDGEEREADGGGRVDVGRGLQVVGVGPRPAGPAGLRHAVEPRRPSRARGERPVRAISRIDCCGKIGAIPAPARRIASTWPGVASPIRSPKPKLGSRPRATQGLIARASDAPDSGSVRRPRRWP